MTCRNYIEVQFVLNLIKDILVEVIKNDKKNINYSVGWCALNHYRHRRCIKNVLIKSRHQHYENFRNFLFKIQI
ncbi:hypothetical protein BpHYR1_004677 [Brachionus plicatilis]|uniref:Uncharacterized protein n=1 Tax=Brachionus plicatilis TaxID=10195 RepID=A0A3M7RZU5_BRAPC|nr:hypothetical protein BpHYR1_004677 [Brachionus plicatilis]